MRRRESRLPRRRRRTTSAESAVEGRGGSDRESLAPTAGREIRQFVSCPRKPRKPKPSTSWKHELPKFCGCQWRAHSPSKDGRLSTPYARAASGGRRPLTAARLRKEEASMKSTALSAEPAPVKPPPRRVPSPRSLRRRLG
jgi:hypothetical protein